MATQERSAVRPESSKTMARSSLTERKRTATSCDRCRSRKSKCVDPVPGPCNYCAAVGASCTIVKRRKRPFYKVSEEEYGYAMKILQKLLPNIDPSLESLRATVREMETDKLSRLPHSPLVQKSSAEDAANAEEVPTLSESESEGLSSKGCDLTVDSAPGNQEAWSSHVQLLAKQMGSLVIDSSGTTRYIGPQSDIVFHCAVRSIAEGGTFELLGGEGYLPPMRAIQLPPPSPESQSAISTAISYTPKYLPPRKCCDTYVTRYFEEVNSSYLLISLEDFYARIEITYNSQGENCSKSWMCFLYSVFALASHKSGTSQASSNSFFNQPSSLHSAVPEPQIAEEDISYSDYMSLAKSLISGVIDEASLDSIRALSVMSILMQNESFNVTAYVNIGMAVCIAYSLGLHHAASYSGMETSVRESALRLWWALYQLDYEISRYRGRPCNITEPETHSRMPAEMSLSSGNHVPWGLTKISIRFGLKEREVCQKLYGPSTSSQRKTSYVQIPNSVNALKSWYSELPSHLQWDIPVAPPHRRPICVLHLRYWGTMISLTRLALLADIHNMDTTREGQENDLSSLGQNCLDACEASLKILKMMHSCRILSSMTVFDIKCLVEISMIFLLVLTRRPNPELQNKLDQSTQILQSMEKIGWCKFAGEELSIIIENHKFTTSADHQTVETCGNLGGLPPQIQVNISQTGNGLFTGQMEHSIAPLDWAFLPWDVLSGVEDPGGVFQM